VQHGCDGARFPAIGLWACSLRGSANNWHSLRRSPNDWRRLPPRAGSRPLGRRASRVLHRTRRRSPSALGYFYHDGEPHRCSDEAGSAVVAGKVSPPPAHDHGAVAGQSQHRSLGVGGRRQSGVPRNDPRKGADSFVVKLHQRIIAFDFVSLAAGHIEGQRVAFGVGTEVDLGREPAARTAERFLILIPPFTPAACW
jgi:hypothetical protein